MLRFHLIFIIYIHSIQDLKPSVEPLSMNIFRLLLAHCPSITHQHAIKTNFIFWPRLSFCLVFSFVLVELPSFLFVGLIFHALFDIRVQIHLLPCRTNRSWRHEPTVKCTQDTTAACWTCKSAFKCWQLCSEHSHIGNFQPVSLRSCWLIGV